MGTINYPFGTYPRAIIRSDLTAHAKVLYVTLSDYTTTNRLQCYPSKSRLCAQLKWSDHTLEKYTRELTSAGWISRESRRDDGGRFCGWLYHVYTSPNTTSDQAGGSVEPIPAKRNSSRRQNLRVEVKQKLLEEKPKKQEEHTLTGENPHTVSQAESVCASSSGCKTPRDTSVESFKHFVLFPPTLNSGVEQSKVFNAEELETIELTIERYKVQGTLQNLPGLMRYFTVHGVDTSYLPGLRQWKAVQKEKVRKEADEKEIEPLRSFEAHILSCNSCKPGQLCTTGEQLRPEVPERLGCWGCEHLERDEEFGEMSLARCRFQKAVIRHPMTHRCAIRSSDSRCEG